MRLPRWLVVSMLTSCVLGALGAGAWCWVTWPDRTMREFARSMAESNWDDAERTLGVDAQDKLIKVLYMDGWME